ARPSRSRWATLSSPISSTGSRSRSRPTTSTAARGSPMRLATPIAGYETEIGLYGFRELITRGTVDIVQPDIAWAGGFSECRRITALAQAHHLMVAPHAFAGAVLLAAALHFIASI